MRKSKITFLPPDLKAELDQRLVDRNFSAYEEFEAWLTTKGHRIGKSSIHRYGANLERRLAAIKAGGEVVALIAGAAPTGTALALLQRAQCLRAATNGELGIKDAIQTLAIADLAAAVGQLATAAK